MIVKEIDAQVLSEQLGTDHPPRLIDVRSPAEMARGVLPHAEELPLHLLPLRMQDIPKEEPVVLYCRSGARSYQACAYLMARGYMNVINLRGGILDWLRYGHPLVPPQKG